MAIRRKVRTFIARLKYAWTNARRSKKEFKDTGIVRLPNGSVLVHPKKSLSQFGLQVVPLSTGYSDYGYGDEDYDEDEDYLV